MGIPPGLDHMAVGCCMYNESLQEERGREGVREGVRV